MPLTRRGATAVRIAVIISLLAATAAYAILHYRMKGKSQNRAWHDHVAMVTERGHPMTLAQIEALRTPRPADSTLAHAITTMAAELESCTPQLTRCRTAMTEASSTAAQKAALDAAATFLQDHADLIARLGADLPCGRFEPIDTDILQQLPAHIPALRSAARLIALDAIVRDDPAPAIATIHRFAQTLDSEPMTISLLVRTGILELAVSVFESVQPQDHDTLVTLENEYARIEKIDALPWSLLGERASLIEGLEGTPTLGTYVQRTQQLTLSEMIESILATGDGYERLCAARESVARMAASPTFIQPYAGAGPDFSAMVSTHHRALARLRCAQVAAAARRLFLRRGTAPDQIDSLVPDYIADVPNDPFFDGHIRLHCDTAKCTAYSVGEDGEDDTATVDSVPSDDNADIRVTVRLTKLPD